MKSIKLLKTKILPIALSMMLSLQAVPVYALDEIIEDGADNAISKEINIDEDESILQGYEIANTVSGNDIAPIVETTNTEITEDIEENEKETIVDIKEDKKENDIQSETEETEIENEPDEEFPLEGDSVSEGDIPEETSNIPANENFKEDYNEDIFDSEEPSEEAIEEIIEYEEAEYVEIIGNSSVTVKGVLPVEANITIEEISVSNLEITDIENFIPVKAYDITIRDKNGSEFQPNSIGEILSISVSNVDIAEESLVTIRIEDADSTMEVPSFIEDGEVVFEAEHFTVYVVGTINAGTADEIPNPYLAPDGNEYSYMIEEDDYGNIISIVITHIKKNEKFIYIPQSIKNIPVKVDENITTVIINGYTKQYIIPASYIDNSIADVCYKTEYLFSVQPLALTIRTSNNYPVSQYLGSDTDRNFNYGFYVNEIPYGSFGTQIGFHSHAVWVEHGETITASRDDSLDKYINNYGLSVRMHNTITDTSCTFNPSFNPSVGGGGILASEFAPVLWYKYPVLEEVSGVTINYDGNEHSLLDTNALESEISYIYVDETYKNEFFHKNFLEMLDEAETISWNNGFPKGTDVGNKLILYRYIKTGEKVPYFDAVISSISAPTDYTIKMPAVVSLNDFQKTHGYYGSEFTIDITINSEIKGKFNISYNNQTIGYDNGIFLYSEDDELHENPHFFGVHMHQSDFDYLSDFSSDCCGNQLQIDSEDTAWFSKNNEDKRQAFVRMLIIQFADYVATEPLTGELVVYTKFTPEY